MTKPDPDGSGGTDPEVAPAPAPAQVDPEPAEADAALEAADSLPDVLGIDEQSLPQSADHDPSPRTIVWCTPDQIPLMQAIAMQAGLTIIAAGGPSGDLGKSISTIAPLASSSLSATASGSGSAPGAGEPFAEVAASVDAWWMRARSSMLPEAGPVPCDDLRQTLLNEEHDLLLLGTLDGTQPDDLTTFVVERGERIAALEPAVEVGMGERVRSAPEAIAFVPAFRDSAAFQIFSDARDRFANIASVSIFFAGRPEHGPLAARAADAIDFIEALLGTADLVDAGFTGPPGARSNAAKRLHGHMTFNCRGLSNAAACGHITNTAGAWSRRVVLVDVHGRIASLSDDLVEWRDAAGEVVHRELVGGSRHVTAATDPTVPSRERSPGGASTTARAPTATAGAKGSTAVEQSATAAAPPDAERSAEHDESTASVGDSKDASVLSLVPEPTSADPRASAWSAAARAIAPALRALCSTNPAVVPPGLVDPIRAGAVVETLALSLRTGQSERPDKIEVMFGRK
ncbi:MAG: hypothetical protein ACOC0P_03420 [Planctomycetota bacterium]